ncbi:MAG: hypothetical protein LBE56_12455 [Tannerella sp.]|nr:hypothetical protein [Tannerella sp.]
MITRIYAYGAVDYKGNKVLYYLVSRGDLEHIDSVSYGIGGIFIFTHPQHYETLYEPEIVAKILEEYAVTEWSANIGLFYVPFISIPMHLSKFLKMFESTVFNESIMRRKEELKKEYALKNLTIRRLLNFNSF